MLDPRTLKQQAIDLTGLDDFGDEPLDDGLTKPASLHRSAKDCVLKPASSSTHPSLRNALLPPSSL